jgi:hypothetical protein
MSDLGPLISEAMARVKHPTDARPSISDVHRRARRSNRRRMTATVGAVACTGVATAALLIRRDSDTTRVATSADTDGVDGAFASYPPVTSFPLGVEPTTTMVPMQPATVVLDAAFVWDALANLQSDPSAIGFVAPLADPDRSQMPAAETFNCTTDGCVCMLVYVVWHEVARALGFSDVTQMQGMNPGIDFSQLPRTGDVVQAVYSSFFEPTTTNPNDETPTTVSLFEGIVLIDGGAPEGAMEDAYQRLMGYNRTIVPGSGKLVEKTVLMPIGLGQPMAAALGELFGIKDLAPWDPTLVASPVEGIIAVVIGPDYWDLVQNLPPTTTTVAATTTSIGP